MKRGYEAHILGEAPNKFKDPLEALKTLKVFDQSFQKPLHDPIGSS